MTRAPSGGSATPPPPALPEVVPELLPEVVPEVVTEATETALELLARGRGHIVVMAPAGYGKTTALRQLERGGRTLGLRLHRDAPEEGLDHRDVVVVDDAHLLPLEALHRLTALANAGTRVLAATKPPPPGSALGPGLGVLAEAGEIVGLEPWLVDEVDSLLGARQDDAWATLDAETVVQLTGGLPWLVTKLLEDPASVGRPPRPGQPTGPERQVLRVVDRLPPRVGEVLMALCAGYPVDRGPLPQPLQDLGSADVRNLLDRLYAAGVLTRHGHVPPLVRQAVLLHVPRHRIQPHLSESLFEDLTAAGVDLEPIAAELAGAGLRDPRLAAALEARGEARLEVDPTEAAALFQAAAHCWGEGSRLAVRRAEVLAMSGDLGASSAALDRLPDHPGSDGAGLRVAATGAVLSGRLRDAAALCRWAAGQEGLLRAGRATSVAAYVLYGDGSREQADALLAAEQGDMPALTGSPMQVMATAVRSSLGPHPSAALSALVQASRAPIGRRELLPDQPASLGALVALHGGDLAMADSLLSAALGQRGGLLPADRSRAVALRAWTNMQAGQYAEAHAHLAELELEPAPRDEPWMWGLRVGLARRQDDVRALARHWVDARGVLVGHPVDLYSLLPLGEIGLAAARMGEPDLAEPLWARAMDLLEGLGTPPLWAPAFHWYGVQAAILTNRPKAMAPHAAVLVAAARTSPFAAALAGAGRTWIAVLGRHVDPAQVEPAARELASVGQLWEGARLAGHAAARADDRKDAASLLECARDLLAATTSPDAGHTAAPASASEWKTGAVPLSRREREVVELVLSGLTYRQVGETLYLSAKTVEHHIARIKRRSGVATRSELLDRLSISVR